jgi:hypothetical protein
MQRAAQLPAATGSWGLHVHALIDNDSNPHARMPLQGLSHTITTPYYVIIAWHT